jgi:ribose-phosphate pyrophosphokinase
MKIISGSSNKNLAQNIADQLAVELVDCDISDFKNGEKRVWIKDKMRGDNVSIVQSFSQPVDSHIIETLLMIDSLERLGAKHVNVIIPWMGYSLQDKVFRPGEPIAAKVIANIISNSYARRVFLMDLHNPSIPAFFSIPTEHLSADDIFAVYLKDKFDLDQSIVVSPDFGGLKRARTFAKSLGLNMANIDKHRNLKTGQVTAVNVHGGDVTDKIALIFDDVIMSGSTVVESAKLLKEKGAKQVHFLSTHGVLCDNAIQKIQQSQIDSVVITNSIDHPGLNSKLQILDTAPVFVEAVKRWM